MPRQAKLAAYERELPGVDVRKLLGATPRLLSYDVARVLPASICETTLKVDRPGAKALALIDKLRRDPGAGRRRPITARLDAATLAAPLHPQRPRPPPATLKSTEICSGSGILSNFLRLGRIETFRNGS